MDINVENFINQKYNKIKLLKQTNRSEVWLAADNAGTVVIMKKIFKSGLPYKFIKENPHAILPKIIYCAESDNETLVIEEYIQGESLAERLQRKAYLTQDEAVSIMLQLCNGLNLLHSNNIIHRDIKPEHLILQGSFVKLIDFDSAHIYKEGKTEDTELLGTKGYAPPEQYGFSQSDARNDIYAIGVTIKKLLADNYSGYLNDILSKCTENNPNHRYQSVMELKFAILNPRKKTSSKTFNSMIAIFITFTVFYFSHDLISNSNFDTITSSKEAETIKTKSIEYDNQSKSKQEVNRQDEKYKFPDITMPTAPIQLTSTTDTIESKPKSLPQLPNQSSFEIPEIPQAPQIPKIPTEQDVITSEEPQENIYDNSFDNCIKVEYYANGSRLNSWVDNWNYDITNAGTIQYIKSNIWKNWQISETGLNIPSSYIQFQVRVINYSQNVFYNPRLDVIYNGIETKTLNGRTLQPGEEMTFDVPFNQTQIHDSNLGHSDVKYAIQLNVSGTGAEIHGTSTEYELILLKNGE